jgi:hypothetical protein
VPCITGFFQHWNRRYDTFAAWGGHTPPVPGITLKHTFPNLRWVAFEPQAPPDRIFNRYSISLQPQLPVVDPSNVSPPPRPCTRLTIAGGSRNAFRTELPDEFHVLPERALMPLYIHGYFFNHRFWHHRRDLVLQTLAFHPAIREYVTFLYGDWVGTEAQRPQGRESVSVHLRHGYGGEPAAGLLEVRRFPSDAFYDRVFGTVFDAKRVRYLVFSDNNAAALAFMRRFAARHSLEWHLVDENVAVSTHLMARCQHHVLTSSTLSFWGAYLDPHQPTGGRTVLHPSFFADHGHGMLPPDFNWTVLE